MESTPIDGQLHDFCHCSGTGEVIFFYAGYFSQNIIAAVADAVKMRIEHVGAEGLTRRKLFSSFIEMAQNIIHYSADAYEKTGQSAGQSTGQTDHGVRHGSVCITAKDERYYLHCANPVLAEVADRLREKLEHLRTLTIDEIKREYKEMLRAETPEDSKGAGLGLLTMARDASEPLEFQFAPGAGGNSMFYLKATI
ncbi:MAG TPA: SiaB family protein kinase [Herbaspirillum sp.]|jgi:hypothetical protein